MLRRRNQLPSRETVSTKGSKKSRKDSSNVLGETVIDAREAILEEEVLGIGENVLEALSKSQAEQSDKKRKRKKKRIGEHEPAKKWADSDDEQAADFEIVTPSWANTFDDEKSDDSDEELLKAHSYNHLTTSANLPSDTLDFKRVTDANKEDPCKASIHSVEFHPKATVLLTGSPDSTVKLFAVDGSKNRKIHSMFFERMPVFTTHFSRGGSEIVIGSKNKNFYVYDMEGNSGVTFRPKLKGLEVEAMSKFVVSPDGRFLAFLGTDGYVHLFSQVSKELIDSVKMNGYVISVSFSNDGRFMYTFGSDGDVYVWDMSTRDCIHHFHDEGCIMGTSVTVSPDNNYIVCGSRSGIVNVYERESVMESRRPKPLKVLKNLTTKCSGLMFNSQTEILALRSKDTEKGIRLAHFPSMHVFPNFPEQFDHDMKMLKCMDFSPSSGYLALGNNKGQCLLYRLQHYSKY